MKDALGYYRILEVSENADAETIKHSYRDLAKRWHPDYNKDKDTTDIFQKLSVAYETLSEKKTRLVYDILSVVYNQDNYPDLEAMTPFKDENEGVNLRVLKLQKVKAWFIAYKVENQIKAVSYPHALRLALKISLLNWAAGWWHPKAFVKNIGALIKNFKQPVSSEESLRVWVHNMIAYAKDNQPLAAVKCGQQAAAYASAEDRALIEEYMKELNVRAAAPKAWNLPLLKACQLVVPFLFAVALFVPSAGSYLNLSEAELWNLFAKKKEIDYYQQVDFGARGKSVDDVVVGKVMSIPVDKSDASKLYHLLVESQVMYGPSANFDAIKTLSAETTVRLTGVTPDNVWARVMIDNGETGFVRLKDIAQGVGKEVPFGSAIIE